MRQLRAPSRKEAPPSLTGLRPFWPCGSFPQAGPPALRPLRGYSLHSSRRVLTEVSLRFFRISPSRSRILPSRPLGKCLAIFLSADCLSFNLRSAE